MPLPRVDIEHVVRTYCPATIRNKIKGIRRLNWLLPHPLSVIRPPLVNAIELTNACPMHCIACPRATAMTRPVGFIDMGLFKKVIDEIASLWPARSKWYGLYLHHFGESLLHPRFDEAMIYAREKGFRAMLSCNPLVMTEERAQRLFAAHPAEIWMMMDGIDDETFFRTRGVKNAYDVSLRQAIRAFEIKEAVSPETDLKIVAIDFPAFRGVVDKVEAYWKENHGLTIQRKEYNSWGDLTPDASGMPREKYADGTCHFPWRGMVVTWDGTVVPCCRDYDCKYPLGNVREDSLTDIWNSERMKALRADLRTRSPRNALCRDCSTIYHGKR